MLVGQLTTNALSSDQTAIPFSIDGNTCGVSKTRSKIINDLTHEGTIKLRFLPKNATPPQS